MQGAPKRDHGVIPINSSLLEAAMIADDKNIVMYEAGLGLNRKSIEAVFDEDGKFPVKE
jgi:hypothetical protein